MLTTKQVADRLNISTDQVLKLIQSGDLPAFNLAPSGAARAFWRVKESDLAAFLESRQARRPPKVRRRRKAPERRKYF